MAENMPNYRYADDGDDDSGLAGFVEFCDWTIMAVAVILTILTIGVIWLCKFHLTTTVGLLGLMMFVCLIGLMTIGLISIKSETKEMITGIAAGLGTFVLLILGIVFGIIAITSQAWAQVAFIMAIMFLTVIHERMHIVSSDNGV